MYGEKMDRWIAQATQHGLDIVISDNSDKFLQSISATIRRQPVDVENALDMYKNSQTLFLHSVRLAEGGKWTNSARYSSCGTDGLEEIALGVVKYRIDSLAE